MVYAAKLSLQIAEDRAIGEGFVAADRIRPGSRGSSLQNEDLGEIAEVAAVAHVREDMNRGSQVSLLQREISDLTFGICSRRNLLIGLPLPAAAEEDEKKN